MQTSSDYNNYSDSYRAQLSKAIEESKSLGFARDPFFALAKTIPDTTLSASRNLINDFSSFLSTILPGYWGSSCQTLSTNIFAHLNLNGIPADIVLGNVIINGTDEFEVTLDSLREEVQATEPLKGQQAVHAWVSLGDDTIIDAALPPRLAMHYRAPAKFNDLIFIGRATEFSTKFKVQYQPILVGTEFFAKTNPPDPVALLQRLKEVQSRQ